MIDPMAAGRNRIVLAESFDADAVARLQAVGEVLQVDCAEPEELASAVAQCDALLVRTRTQVTQSLLERATRLRVIGRAGVGLDNIDLVAARRRGVIVVYTPCASTEAVADLTVGMMIAMLRNLAGLDAAVRSGRHEQARHTAAGRELHELRLGIVGLGRIGRAVARRCNRGFGMEVVFNDIVNPEPLDFLARGVEKEELFRESDVVSLHVPLTPQTRHLIDEQALSGFKPGSLLINTARGAVVHSEALAASLASGRLGGAALDVTEPEPLPERHPLLSAPHTLLTPHIGAKTNASQARMNAVVDDVLAVLEGRPPQHPA
jgi:phosphoglycerate dehydrogenase-like enzyme